MNDHRRDAELADAVNRLIRVDPVAAALHHSALAGAFGPDNQQRARERAGLTTIEQEDCYETFDPRNP